MLTADKVFVSQFCDIIPLLMKIHVTVISAKVLESGRYRVGGAQ